jgi:hypothetical protein
MRHAVQGWEIDVSEIRYFSAIFCKKLDRNCHAGRFRKLETSINRVIAVSCGLVYMA